MRLFQHSSYSLTTDQKSALEKIESFLSSNTNCFLLKGYAGTGKTFLMGVLIEYLESIKRPYQLMAPTGRASMIIGQKTESSASTIHRAIYDFDRLVDKPTTFQFGYELSTNDSSVTTVYIVDESSMVSDIHSEDEFFSFGSGHLLQDLITYVGIQTHEKSKLIFIGDNAQLPPVGMKTSPALNANYLKEKYGIDSEEIELTEVVRQRKDNPVLSFATQLRQSLVSKKFNRFDLPKNTKEISIIKSDEFLQEYTSQQPVFPTGESIVITYSNKCALEYNQEIRKHYYGTDRPISAGDYIIFTRNSYNYEVDLLNGMFSRVIDASDTTEERTTTFFLKNKEKVTIKHRFRDIVIEVDQNKSEKLTIRCKVIDQFLESPMGRLHPYEQRALYIDFKYRHTDLKAGTKEFKDALKNDLYFNALQTKYGYAITCHKAQGGEWKKAFVDFNVSMGLLSESFYRWAYTAVTRSMQELFAIDAKQYVPLSQYIVKDIEKLGSIDTDMYYTPEIIIDEKDDEIFRTYPFLKNKLNEIEQKLENQDVKFTLTHKSYQELYSFSRGDEMYSVGLSYNKKGFNDYKQEIKRLGTELPDFIINVVLQRFVHPITLQVNTDYQKDLYDYIVENTYDFDILITNIIHRPYCDRYYLKTDGDCAYIDFCYDKNGIYTTIMPKSTLGQNDEKLQMLVLNFK
jgi:hypothetical protein